MALEIGDVNASGGLAKAINDKLKEVLGPPVEAGGADMTEVHSAWAKLSFALSGAIVEYLTANMEVYGVETTGNIASAPGGNLLSTQSNDGTGHVR